LRENKFTKEVQLHQNRVIGEKRDFGLIMKIPEKRSKSFYYHKQNFRYGYTN